MPSQSFRNLGHGQRSWPGASFFDEWNFGTPHRRRFCITVPRTYPWLPERKVRPMTVKPESKNRRGGPHRQVFIAKGDVIARSWQVPVGRRACAVRTYIKVVPTRSQTEGYGPHCPAAGWIATVR